MSPVRTETRGPFRASPTAARIRSSMRRATCARRPSEPHAKDEVDGRKVIGSDDLHWLAVPAVAVVSCFRVSKIDTADRRCDECDEEVKK